MMSNVIDNTIFVGVDVSKATLDVHRTDSIQSLKIDNSVEAVLEYFEKLQKLKRSLMVVMEATCGYETLLVNQLAKLQIPAATSIHGRCVILLKGSVWTRKPTQSMLW